MKSKNNMRIAGHSPYEETMGFCRARRIGDVIHVAGTAPIAEDGSPAFPGDMYQQTLHCFGIVKRAIEEAGGDIRDVVRTRMFLTNITRWEEAGKAHGHFFSSVKPVSTMVGIDALINPEWLIEVEAECIISS